MGYRRECFLYRFKDLGVGGLEFLEVEIPEYGLQSRVHGSSRARSGEFYLIVDVMRCLLAVAGWPQGPFDPKRFVLLFVVAQNRTSRPTWADD